ncbi:hypothetical protein MTR_2g104410 [Medicago truncatula]|uniref:RNase H type-1 domain-containing protein n=1 Tax=Medicago truncatula TaxID=3880 RepID=G7IM97_MEDTR|nr:hypothetical protein MTR_2g104410 [Medicago truncatula]
MLTMETRSQVQNPVANNLPSNQVGPSNEPPNPEHSPDIALKCDYVVLNCDLNAACGGLIQDDQGHFVFHYANKLGSCSVLQAELWGI